MKIPFHKYQGTGNDFVMIDNRNHSFRYDVQEVAKICDRRFGVGADGLIAIESHPQADFEMVYFNADGSQSLCGNGSRCAVRFAHAMGIISHTTRLLTTDGALEARLDDEQVAVRLKDQKPPEKHKTHDFIHNGSPHHVEWVSAIESTDVCGKGREIRHSAAYAPGGTNVNFVKILNRHSLFVRTYERGVENETLSCGTGVVASALAAYARGVHSPVTIQTKGGHLTVCFETKADLFTDIWLSGPAQFVFEGFWQL